MEISTAHMLRRQFSGTHWLSTRLGVCKIGTYLMSERMLEMLPKKIQRTVIQTFRIRPSFEDEFDKDFIISQVGNVSYQIVYFTFSAFDMYKKCK